MTKKEIINVIAEKLRKEGEPINKNYIRAIVETTFDVFIGKLVEEGRIEIRDFGTFKMKRSPARVGRNPVTKEEAVVPARNIVQFKAGKYMKEMVIKEKK